MTIGNARLRSPEEGHGGRRCITSASGRISSASSTRAVRFPVAQPAGRAWLNGPLVWAIDALHSDPYLYPRECPRIVAFVETGWERRLAESVLFRYELPTETFEDRHDASMWVSRATVAPRAVVRIDDLAGQLRDAGVALRWVADLARFKPIWSSSLHASGIRLRNARTWS